MGRTVRNVAVDSTGSVYAITEMMTFDSVAGAQVARHQKGPSREAMGRVARALKGVAVDRQDNFYIVHVRAVAK